MTLQVAPLLGGHLELARARTAAPNSSDLDGTAKRTLVGTDIVSQLPKVVHSISTIGVRVTVRYNMQD
jgi:hypothetical protein